MSQLAHKYCAELIFELAPQRAIANTVDAIQALLVAQRLTVAAGPEARIGGTIDEMLQHAHSSNKSPASLPSTNEGPAAWTSSRSNHFLLLS